MTLKTYICYAIKGRSKKWKSNQRQCFVLQSFLGYVEDYVEQWWTRLFHKETKTLWAASVGEELVKVLVRGQELLLLCENDWFNTNAIIPGGPAEFCEIVDDAKRYAQMMNNLIGYSMRFAFANSATSKVIKHLKDKVESDSLVIKMTLNLVSEEDKSELLDAFNTSKPNNFISGLIPMLERSKFPSKPNIHHSHMQRQETLGAGSFGEVYKAKWFNLLVAVKEFPYEDVWFQPELDMLMKLQASGSSHILQLIGHSEHSVTGSKQLILELMDTDLARYIKEKKRIRPDYIPIPINKALDIMIQIAKAMQHLHENNVIYRDMKPMNILVKRLKDDQILVKLADFGYSKVYLASKETHTYNRGTLFYMAPEMLQGDDGIESGSYTPNVDVYSFGITCSEILTGKPPFQSGIGRKVLKELLQKGERPNLPLETPEKLVKLLQRCWDNEPQKRPSFADICEELWHVKEEQIAHENGEASYEAGEVSYGGGELTSGFGSISPTFFSCTRPNSFSFHAHPLSEENENLFYGIGGLIAEGLREVGSTLTASFVLYSDQCLVQWIRHSREGILTRIKSTLFAGFGKSFMDEYKVSAADCDSWISVYCSIMEDTLVIEPMCAFAHIGWITGSEIKRLLEPSLRSILGYAEFDVKIEGKRLAPKHHFVLSKANYWLSSCLGKVFREDYCKVSMLEADTKDPQFGRLTTNKGKEYKLQFKSPEICAQAVSTFKSFMCAQIIELGDVMNGIYMPTS